MKTSEAIIVEGSDPNEALLGKNSEYEISLIIKCLTALNENVHFKTYIEKVIGPELKKKYAALRAEKDPIAMYRLQGHIEALERVRDIELKTKYYKDKIVRIYGESKKGK